MRAKILNASAGSGKTYQLAYKYVSDVLGSENERGDFDATAYRRIIAVTFTNKATEEMKSRILRQIHTLAAGEGSDYLAMLMRDTGKSEQELRRRAKRVRTAILHDYSRFTILTNDTFFQRILRAFIKELGIELNYSLELDTAPILSKSADAVIGDISSDRELYDWVMEMAKDRIEAGEKWNIRDGILLLHNELFKEYTKEAIAHATDKKELKRIVFGFAAKAEKAVDELRATAQKAIDTVAEAGLSESDFKRGTIGYLAKVAAGSLDLPTKTVAALAGGTPDAWFAKTRKATPDMLAVAQAIQPLFDKVCADIPAVAEFANSRTILLQNYRSFALLNDLYRKSLEICREENTMLLSETKHIISQFITENDTPFIYEKVGNRFDRYMIDEFQDTSLGEWRNFLPLLRNAMSQCEDISVLLVGDIKQSIYRWRGSDWNILGSIAPDELGRGDTEIETLGCNYRSLPTIVEFNNMIFDRAVTLDNAELNTMLETARSQSKISGETYAHLHDTLLRAYAGHRQKPQRKCTNGGYVNITVCSDEPDIVGRVKSIIDKGYRPCDITVLVRSKNDGYEIARRLLSVKDEGDPRYRFDVMTQEALKLGNSPAVAFIIAILRLAVNRRDKLSLAIYDRYRKDCDFTAQLTDEENAFLDSLRVMSPEEAFENIVMKYSPEKEGQTAYVQALHETVVKFCASRVADIALFLKWWDESGDGKSVNVERSESAIEIMTVHKAKGLENKVVIIPYCKWDLNPSANSGWKKNTIWAEPSANSGIDGLGTFPVSFNKAVADSAFAEGFYAETVYSHVDAINLLYVALTRAAEQLHVFIPERATKQKTAGRFICDALPADGFVEHEDGTRVCEFGENTPPEPFDKKPNESMQVRLDEYTSSPVNLRLRLPSARYFEEGEQVRITPRNMGISLHRVFENAASRDDIAAAIRQMVIDGVLSDDEAAALTTRIEQTLANTVAGEWFDGDWTLVRRENNIIVPAHGMLRPDRVMIRGRQAVVVDYKFGKAESSHAGQVAEYADMLRSMGYDDVRGYIWYVKSGEIMEVAQ